MILAAILALSVTASDAITAVRGWVRQGGTLEAVGMPVEAVPETTDAGNRFYAVRTTQGTVWTQGDTDYEPIIAFTAADGDFAEPDKRGPMWALLTASVDGAVYDSEALAKWQALWAKGEVRRLLLAAASGFSEDNDIRVKPLTKSKWGQYTVGNYINTDNCYNLFTPGNCVCGCVATAMAQVMYYHKYPTAPVTAQTKTCSYERKLNSYTMMGGVYDWAEMVDDPQTGTTQAQRNAIGKLTYDCGVAAHMHWEYFEFGSATDDAYAEAALYEVFGYKSATVVKCNDLANTANIKKAILCNLDAGYPVMLGICCTTGGESYNGHSVVGDGYGFAGDTLYLHINMGWDGDQDLWYTIPNIGTKYSFNTLTDVVYNIIPGNDIKAVFSGRVVDANSKAVANMPVAIYCEDTLVTNLITSAYGVFGFATSTESTNYRVVVAECANYLEATKNNCSLVSPSVIDYSSSYINDSDLGEHVYIDRYVANSGNIGNSWGNDLTLTKNTKTDQSVTASAESAGGSSVAIPLSWFINEGLASGTTPVSEMSAKTLELAANGVNSVAECYVIGISPTNETAQFTADISFNEDGTVKIEHDPNLKDRTYTTKYSTDLKTWNTWTDQAPEGAFFKVEVSK